MAKSTFNAADVLTGKTLSASVKVKKGDAGNVLSAAVLCGAIAQLATKPCHQYLREKAAEAFPILLQIGKKWRSMFDEGKTPVRVIDPSFANTPDGALIFHKEKRAGVLKMIGEAIGALRIQGETEAKEALALVSDVVRTLRSAETGKHYTPQEIDLVRGMDENPTDDQLTALLSDTDKSTVS